MSMLLRLIPILVAMCLSPIETVHQLRPDSVGTTKNFTAKESFSTEYYRMRTVDANNQHQVPAFSSKSQPSIFLSNNKTADKPNTLTFQTQMVISARHEHRNLAIHISSLTKRRALRNQIRKSYTATWQIRGSNADTEIYFSRTAPNSSKDRTSITGESTDLKYIVPITNLKTVVPITGESSSSNLKSVVPITGESSNLKSVVPITGKSSNLRSIVPITVYNGTGIIWFNSTKNETNNYSQTNASMLDMVALSPIVSNEIQRAQRTVQNRESGSVSTVPTSQKTGRPILALFPRLRKSQTMPWKSGALNRCACVRTKCDFAYCRLESVPEDLPTSITELLLNNNMIKTLPVNAFSRYIHLEHLVLSYNGLSVLAEGSFYGLSGLRYLDLSNNYIQRDELLPINIFEPLKSLKILRMEFNTGTCPSSPLVVLSYLRNVEELHIDNYIDPQSGDIFGPEFRNMSSLRKLTVTCVDCNMEFLWNSTFINLGHITSLDINTCNIVGSLIEADTFAHLRSLEALDISENKNIGMEFLHVILWGLNSSNLQNLTMNSIVKDYSVTTINSSVTESLPRTLTTITTRGNNIVFIDRNSVNKLPKTLRTLDIGDNNIFTDPEDIPLEQIVQLETLLISNDVDGCVTDHQHPSLKTTVVKLGWPESKNCVQKNNKIRNLITVRSFIPWTLKRVQITVGSMHDDYLMNIDERNNLQEIDISCSFLQELNFGSFQRLPNLRSLIVSRSSVRVLIVPPFFNIYSVETLILEGNFLNDFLNSFGSSFYYLVNLLHLDLSLNQLNSLPRDLLYGLEKLEYLRLDRNSFTVFGADLSHMAQLKLLNLSNTELPNLPSDTRAHIDQLCKVKPGQVRVYMSGCPILCDCFNLDFLKWMVRSTAFDKNFTGYNCRYSDTSLKYIQDGYQETIAVLDRECAKNYPMFLVVLAATSVLLCSVVGAVVYRFRWKIRYLYYAAYLKIMDKRKNDNQHEFAYDAFISYDSEDQGFVTRLLAPELEKRGLKLLVHTRDFVAGTYIASNIVMAVAESRKTLVLLTRNLLESSWCNYELQMATMEAVHTGRQVLVFLLKEDIPSRELEVDLLRHIRSNTYVPYPIPEEEGDDDVMGRFYDKLAHDLRR